MLAYHNISHAKSEVQFLPATGCIEATLYYDTHVFVTFSALEGRKPSTESQGENGQANMELEYDSRELNLLDGDVDDLPGKLEQYMKKMAAIFYDREPSPFVRATLSLAKELSVEKKVRYLPNTLCSLELERLAANAFALSHSCY